MSQHGATLQTYNQELVKCLEDLKMKRNEMLIIVKREEQEKQSIEKNMDLMRDKLNVVTESLEKHRSLCESYEKTIQDTEAGFKKIARKTCERQHRSCSSERTGQQII
ncbi:Sjoegren syndrome nuclear autoantigen 1 homolog isoform X2 [Tribolium madens]|uniref:Sjoegren syndrome nuclear autoantigen 1 homolog isoform X2 n=1 Tax=Tribolium madens TaxID=41895 RepID=UPI001CF7274D|nr:Sjoegren syndrome nuclear autoantigen 1 homolog isoform X2 [Tribolium madens]